MKNLGKNSCHRKKSKSIAHNQVTHRNFTTKSSQLAPHMRESSDIGNSKEQYCNAIPS